MSRMFVRSILRCVLLLLVLSSCKSNEELIYMRNLSEEESIQTTSFSTDSYLLRSGDNLYINVSSMSPEVTGLFNPQAAAGNTSGGTAQAFNSVAGQYLNGYQVDSKGNIELPIVGKVAVVGKTIAEVKSDLDGVMAEYFKEVTVTVKLMSFKVTVMGEVARPGLIFMYNNTCTVLEAISEAGGTTDYSRLKRALVVRETSEGVVNIKVDLTDKSLLSSSAYYLHPGDVVYVWPDRYKNTRLNASLYALMLSTISTMIVVLSFLNN
ncbi:polysaccharide biosynthesis/export family protein [Mangrovibacterium diazotrophicum]|uniref:Polysaccharide export outer membrane protein n=1 Tax=Mangrovibacterium diazotrophicum TaxID=1261403 RepID=A0A419VX16_9BACT|nr:polysaccharide biosynthesis/export family protein [Mangrovibacterium diazotrophicum]RKD87729.1 polysaccharide export outer membrane protein [Mangrovibacterium diazotrophicum]